MFFSIIGQLVDWFGRQDRQTLYDVGFWRKLLTLAPNF